MTGRRQTLSEIDLNDAELVIERFDRAADALHADERRAGCAVRLPARGRHRQGSLFLRLTPDPALADGGAQALLKRFAAAWAA